MNNTFGYLLSVLAYYLLVAVVNGVTGWITSDKAFLSGLIVVSALSIIGRIDGQK